MGAISVINSGSLPFQAHFKWVRDLLLQAAQIVISPFKKLLKRGTYHLQKNILKSMHEHSFSNIILELSSNCHCVWLRSCVGPSSDAWLSTYLIIPFFRMTFNIFSLTLHTRLGLLHPIAHGLSQCICD